MSTWVKWNRNASPTKAATEAANALAGSINLGQGREIKKDEPDGLMGELLSSNTIINSGYNKKIGGPEDLRINGSGWLNRNIGIETTPETTLVLPGKHGRDLLDEVLIHVSNRHPRGSKIHVMNGSMGWPVTKELANDHNLILDGHDSYDVTHTSPAIAMQMKFMGQETRDRTYGAVVTTYPNNASGRHITVDENLATMGILDAQNETYMRDGVAPIIRAADEPYPHASQVHPEARNPSFRGAKLITGYQGVLKQESLSPWAYMLSGSKCFAKAEDGLTLFAFHPALAEYFSKRLVRSRGLSYPMPVAHNLTQLFAEENDGLILDHFEKLGKKYLDNRIALVEAFGEAIVMHDRAPETMAGMTSLMTLPKEAFNRSVKCSDGVVRETKTTDDILEIIANQDGKGTVMVNNGVDKDGNAVVRIAQAQRPEDFQEGINRIQEHLGHIMNSPSLAA